MWPALAVLGSSIAGNIFASKGAKEANAASAESVSDQMAFQERMSNTAWQRGVEDMKKAGINPLYGFAPASSPSGASYTAQNVMAPWGGFGSQVTSAVGAYQQDRITTSSVERNAGEITIPGFGRTTLANARRMWKKMSSSAKQLFEEKFPDIAIQIRSNSARSVADTGSAYVPSRDRSMGAFSPRLLFYPVRLKGGGSHG